MFIYMSTYIFTHSFAFLFCTKNGGSHAVKTEFFLCILHNFCRLNCGSAAAGLPVFSGLIRTLFRGCLICCGAAEKPRQQQPGRMDQISPGNRPRPELFNSVKEFLAVTLAPYAVRRPKTAADGPDHSGIQFDVQSLKTLQKRNTAV